MARIDGAELLLGTALIGGSLHEPVLWRGPTLFFPIDTLAPGCDFGPRADCPVGRFTNPDLRFGHFATHIRKIPAQMAGIPAQMGGIPAPEEEEEE